MEKPNTSIIWITSDCCVKQNGTWDSRAVTEHNGGLGLVALNVIFGLCSVVHLRFLQKYDFQNIASSANHSQNLSNLIYQLGTQWEKRYYSKKKKKKKKIAAKTCAECFIHIPQELSWAFSVIFAQNFKFTTVPYVEK